MQRQDERPVDEMRIACMATPCGAAPLVHRPHKVLDLREIVLLAKVEAAYPLQAA